MIWLGNANANAERHLVPRQGLQDPRPILRCRRLSAGSRSWRHHAAARPAGCSRTSAWRAIRPSVRGTEAKNAFGTSRIWRRPARSWFTWLCVCCHCFQAMQMDAPRLESLEYLGDICASALPVRSDRLSPVSPTPNSCSALTGTLTLRTEYTNSYRSFAMCSSYEFVLHIFPYACVCMCVCACVVNYVHVLSFRYLVGPCTFLILIWQKFCIIRI